MLLVVLTQTIILTNSNLVMMRQSQNQMRCDLEQINKQLQGTNKLDSGQESVFEAWLRDITRDSGVDMQMEKIESKGC